MRLPLAAGELGFVKTQDVADAVEGAVEGKAVVAVVVAAELATALGLAADIAAVVVAPLFVFRVALDIAAAAADIAVEGVGALAPVAPR